MYAATQMNLCFTYLVVPVSFLKIKHTTYVVSCNKMILPFNHCYNARLYPNVSIRHLCCYFLRVNYPNDSILSCLHFLQPLQKPVSLQKKNQHYTNMSVQYTAIFHGCKNDNFQMNFFLYIPQFYYIKVGCKGVFVTKTCFRDECK